MAVALAGSPARAADRATYIFQGKQFTFTEIVDQPGRALSIDDPGLQALLNALGATVTYQQGQRYVLITSAEPVVISFAIGDRSYDVGPITQTAAFAPFLQDGHAYVPFDELLHALDLTPKSAGGQMILQPQLASIDLQSDAGGTKMVAHGGIPLDGKIVSQSSDRVIIAFDGVGSTLAPSREVEGGAVHRIDVRTEGNADRPITDVTLYLTPGTTHTGIGTDDQRDLTMGFNGAPAGQPVAEVQPGPQVSAQPIGPEGVESPQAGTVTPAPPQMVQVTAVETQAQTGSFIVKIAVDGSAAYEWHRLRPPDNRWWIDVHGARLGIPASDQPGSDLVTDVRAHQENGDTVRVALSLADFDVVNVVPDASGVTLTVTNQIADDTAPRTGSGTVGQNAVANAPGTVPSNWKFGPRPATNSYVAANPRLIVIDPGHGGSDTGAIRGDVIEKTVNLDMSKRLRDILVARGWQVIMTRETDRDVYLPNDSAGDELQARDNIANGNGARLLVSLHSNSFINAGPHGVTVYYYKSSDLALAQAVDRRLGSELGIFNNGIVKDKLYIVHHADMPATLVEAAYMSNPDDLQLLASPEWRQKLAKAIADGISDYVGAPPQADPPGN